jgi:hypothetical protein
MLNRGNLGVCIVVKMSQGTGNSIDELNLKDIIDLKTEDCEYWL